MYVCHVSIHLLEILMRDRNTFLNTTWVDIVVISSSKHPHEYISADLLCLYYINPSKKDKKHTFLNLMLLRIRTNFFLYNICQRAILSTNVRIQKCQGSLKQSRSNTFLPKLSKLDLLVLFQSF